MKSLMTLCILFAACLANADVVLSGKREVTITGKEAQDLMTGLQNMLEVKNQDTVTATNFRCSDGFDFSSGGCNSLGEYNNSFSASDQDAKLMKPIYSKADALVKGYSMAADEVKCIQVSKVEVTCTMKFGASGGAL